MQFRQYATHQVNANSFLRFLLSIFMIVSCSAAVLAQQSTQDHPDAPSATKSNDTQRKPPAGFFSTMTQRSIFFPTLATSEGPLSPGEKFKLFVVDSSSLSAIFFSAASAGIGQADDAPKGYGQGAEGYGKRFGAAMARNASDNFFSEFMLASILHQDPRFFPQENPTFGGSIKYSVERVFVTRADDGHDTVNWSGLIGPAMAEGLANAYWPENERTAGNTFERYGLDLASKVGLNFFRNYWPVFFKKMRGSSHASH